MVLWVKGEAIVGLAVLRWVCLESKSQFQIRSSRSQLDLYSFISSDAILTHSLRLTRKLSPNPSRIGWSLIISWP